MRCPFLFLHPLSPCHTHTESQRERKKDKEKSSPFSPPSFFSYHSFPTQFLKRGKEGSQIQPLKERDLQNKLVSRWFRRLLINVAPYENLQRPDVYAASSKPTDIFKSQHQVIDLARTDMSFDFPCFLIFKFQILYISCVI